MGHATDTKHPLKEWRTAAERGFSATDVSALIESRGFDFKPRTVLSVEEGWRHPRYEICKAIEQITQGSVTVDQLRSWPLRDSGQQRKKKRG